MVVQRATKKSLAEFAALNILKPLGTSRTLFYDDHTLVVPGRVAAYDSAPHDSFRVDWSTTFEVVGAGGLMSSVDELLLWDRNFMRTDWAKERPYRNCRHPACSTIARRSAMRWDSTWANIEVCPSWNTTAHSLDTGLNFCAFRSNNSP